MGLDQNLYKFNKKMNAEELAGYKNKNRSIDDYNTQLRFIQEVDKFKNIESYVRHEFKDNLNRYATCNTKENGAYITGYIYNWITSNTPKYTDFKTQTDLVNRYVSDIQNDYEKCKKYISTHEQPIEENIEETELGYWRKHSDLNGYMAQLYEDKGFNEEFNCVDLILDKEDIETLMDLVNKELNGETSFEQSSGFFWGESYKEQWEKTKKIFDSVLEYTDFNNETIVYSCWW